jgi:hypothetical protein
VVDAAVSRQFWQAGDIVRDYQSKAELPPHVVVELGTNVRSVPVRR